MADDESESENPLTRQRMALIEANFAEVVACHGRSLKNGVEDCVVLVLDIHDADARAISKQFSDPNNNTDRMYEKAKREGRILSRCIALERQSAIRLLISIAPQLGKLVPGPAPDDMICVASLSAGGSYCGLIRPTRN